jgi:hypothetical protein
VKCAITCAFLFGNLFSMALLALDFRPLVVAVTACCSTAIALFAQPMRAEKAPHPVVTPFFVLDPVPDDVA